ncbi:hypothetical protein GQ457_04G021130 [Hibiscus cannabinus]
MAQGVGSGQWRVWTCSLRAYQIYYNGRVYRSLLIDMVCVLCIAGCTKYFWRCHRDTSGSDDKMSSEWVAELGQVKRRVCGAVDDVKVVVRCAVEGGDNLMVGACDGEFDIVDQSNLFEVIEFDPNTIGGLVVEHDKGDHLNLNGFNSNVKSLIELENFSSGGQEPISGNIEFLQLGGVCQKVKYVDAIMDVLLSPKQQGVVEEARHKKGPCIPYKGRRRLTVGVSIVGREEESKLEVVSREVVARLWPSDNFELYLLRLLELRVAW